MYNTKCTSDTGKTCTASMQKNGKGIYKWMQAMVFIVDLANTLHK